MAAEDLAQPDLTPYFKKDGSVVATGNLDAGTHLIHNAVDPAAAQDVSTKHYTDAGDTAEAASRVSGDAASVATAEAYSDAALAARKRRYVTMVPGNAIADGTNDPLPTPGVGDQITTIKGRAKTAPTGADLTYTVKIIDQANDTVDSTLGTLTISAGTRVGTLTITATAIGTTKMLAYVTATVGSSVAGADVVLWAE